MCVYVVVSPQFPLLSWCSSALRWGCTCILLLQLLFKGSLPGQTLAACSACRLSKAA